MAENLISTLRCVSWNVHRGRGADGQINPQRIARVIADDIAPQIPDILVLQEADDECPPHAAVLDISGIEQATGLRSVHVQPHLRWGPKSDGFLGVIVLIHPRIAVTDSRIVDLPGHCHRGAVVVDLAPTGVVPLRLVSAHLSLAQWLRAVQMRTLGQHLFRRDAMDGAPRDTVIAGDLNEWRPWGGLAFSRMVVGRPLFGSARRTFPATRPLLPLDRVLADRPDMVSAVEALDSAAIRAASDHRPLMAQLNLRRMGTGCA